VGGGACVVCRVGLCDLKRRLLLGLLLLIW
jgi:hypothetical protein